MERQRLLLLLPRSAYRAGPFIAAATRLGVELVVGTDHATTLPGSRTLELPFANPDRCIEQIGQFADSQPLDAVFGVDERTSLVAAAASRALGLRGNPPSAVALLHDKLHFRRWLTDSGGRTPSYVSIHTHECTPPETGYPWILKPRSLSASRGVIRADDPHMFSNAVRAMHQHSGRSRSQEPWGIAETYIPGAEVALEGILVDGVLHTLALFDKPDVSTGPTFAETIYVAPSRLPDALQRACHDEVQLLVQKLGLTTGPLHAELRVNEQGCWLIEAAARPIGGQCASVLKFNGGTSHEYLLLRQAIGAPVHELTRECAAIGILMLTIDRVGTLTRIEGTEAARNIAAIEDVSITLPVGRAVAPLPWGDPYLGFVFAKGTTPDAVEDALRIAKRTIQPVIE